MPETRPLRRACVLLSPFVSFSAPPLPLSRRFFSVECIPVFVWEPRPIGGGALVWVCVPSTRPSLNLRLAPGCQAGTHTSSHLAAEEESTPTLRCRALSEPSQGHCRRDTFPCQTPTTNSPTPHYNPPPPYTPPPSQFHTQINR